MGGLAKSGHPMAKFMWGNKTSLSPAGLSDEEVSLVVLITVIEVISDASTTS